MELPEILGLIGLGIVAPVPVLATAAALAPTVLPLVGAGMQVAAIDDASKLEAQIAETNAQTADFNADQARKTAERDAGLADYAAVQAELLGGHAAAQVHGETRRVIGSQRATMAAGGIDIGFGTAADLQAATAAMGELDAATIKNNAAREAWGYRATASTLRDGAKHIKSESDQIRLQAKLDALRAKNQKTQTILGGIGQSIGGLTSTVSTIAGFR